MARRSRMSRHHSKKVFRRGAQRIHQRNAPQVMMRGGVRL